MKNFLIIFGFIPFLAFGQIINEVKVEPLGFLGKDFTVSYEAIYNSKFSAQLKLGYLQNELSLVDANPGGTGPVLGIAFTFPERLVVPELSARYYFADNTEANGFFAGPVVNWFILTSFDKEGYAARYQEIVGEELPNDSNFDTGLQSFNFGLNFGYKFLIKSKIPIDIGMNFMRSDFESRQHDFSFSSATNFSGNIFVAVGYRF